MHLMQDTLLLDTLLAGVFKAANSGGPFNFLAADWLPPPRERDKENQVISFSFSTKTVSTVHINAY